MSNLIIKFYPIVIGLTVFFFIALLGYRRESKKNMSKVNIQNFNEDISVSKVSIKELEKSIDSL